ncbi:MAG: hypothetical protein Q8L23_15795 [Caulobacter sp.]|nr:hypothetical protein [Caulobacter sp.]
MNDPASSHRLAAIEATLAYALSRIMSHEDFLAAEAALTGPLTPEDDPETARHMLALLHRAASARPRRAPLAEGDGPT